MHTPGFEVKFQKDLKIAWVLLTLLLLAILMFKHCQVLHGKNISQGGLLFWFFPHFISNYSYFHLNRRNGKGTEAYSHDSCSSDL